MPVLVPTRERALQIGEVFTSIARHTKVKVFKRQRISGKKRGSFQYYITQSAKVPKYFEEKHIYTVVIYGAMGSLYIL
jgi:superfamily II DNA/RNA helicase